MALQGRRRKPWAPAIFVCALLGAVLVCGASEDPEVLEFRAALAAAVESDDLDTLYGLAFETEMVEPVASEVEQLKTVVQQRLDQAFKNRFEAAVDAGHIVALVATGGEKGVSAAELDVARSKARTLAQASVEALLPGEEADSLREAVAMAKAAGVPATVTAPAEAHLAQLADDELKAALEENDLGNLISAVGRAEADGVSATELSSAQQLRNTRVQQAIAASQSSSDLMQMVDAIGMAENAHDLALHEAAESARQVLTQTVNETINHAQELNHEQLGVAVQVATIVGIDSEAATNASEQLAAENARIAASNELKAWAEQKDWWALLVAIQDARAAGVPESEIGVASELVAIEARRLMQQGTGEGAATADAQWALEFGGLAGLSGTELAPALAAVQQAAKSALGAAQGLNGTMDDLLGALRSEHLSESDRASGQAAVQAKVTEWLGSGHLGSGDLERAILLLDSLEPARPWLLPGQFEQLVSEFRVQLNTELKDAGAARSLDRLNVAVAAAGREDRFITFGSGSEEEDEEQDAAAQLVEKRFGELLEWARGIQAVEEAKRQAIVYLEEISTGLDLDDLLEALQAAKDAGCSTTDLVGFEAMASELQSTTAPPAPAPPRPPPPPPSPTPPPPTPPPLSDPDFSLIGGSLSGA